MANLLRKPFGTHGKVHQITPQSAGWRLSASRSIAYARVRALQKGPTTGDHLVMIEGMSNFKAAGEDWGVLGDELRPNAGSSYFT